MMVVKKAVVMVEMMVGMTGVMKVDWLGALMVVMMVDMMADQMVGKMVVSTA